MAQWDNLALSVRKQPDGSRYVYGVEFYGRLFVIGGFPAAGFEADLTEAADEAGETVEFPPVADAMQ